MRTFLLLLGFVRIGPIWSFFEGACPRKGECLKLLLIYQKIELLNYIIIKPKQDYFSKLAKNYFKAF